MAPRVGVRDSQSTLFCVAPRVGVRDSQSTLCCVAPRVGVRDSQSTLFCVAPRVGVRDSQSTLFCVAPRVGVFMDQVTCKFAPTQPPSLKMVQPTHLERTVFLRRFPTTHISFWRKERPKYPEQPVTGVPKVIEQILRFGKGNHLPRDEESVIIQDGLDGQPQGGSEVPTLQPEIDRLRREKREREAKKQAKHAQQVPEKRQRTPDAFCVVAPPWACGFVQLQSPSTLSVLATPCGYTISTPIRF